MIKSLYPCTENAAKQIGIVILQSKTMAKSLKRVKSANNHFKFSVFGYLRDQEKHESINIPMMIKYICLNYYLLTDKFTKCGEKITLHHDNHIEAPLKRVSNYNTAYGDILINNKDESISSFEWTFNVKLGSPIGWIGIGIDSSDKLWINTDFTNKYTFYAFVFSPNSKKASAWYESGTGANATRDSCRMNMKDSSEQKITMIFDVLNGTLKFEMNGELLAMRIYNIDMNADYHMAVVMGYPGQSVTLTQFVIQHKVRSFS